MLLALIRLKQRVVGGIVVCSLVHVLLNCVTLSLDYLCLLGHHDSRWRHVSIWWMCIGYMLRICFI